MKFSLSGLLATGLMVCEPATTPEAGGYTIRNSNERFNHAHHYD